ncbi:hypothetical protein QQ045_001346 [Rhodiola kirilowii]
MKKNAISPDVLTYNSLVHGFCHECMFKDAKGILTEMMSNGFAPDVFTYTSIIGSLCKVGDWKGARHTLNYMLEQGVKPNDITLYVVRTAWSKQRSNNETAQFIVSVIKEHIAAAAKKHASKKLIS